MNIVTLNENDLLLGMSIPIVPTGSYSNVLRHTTGSVYGVFGIVILLLLLCLIYLKLEEKRKHSEFLKEKDRMVEDYEQILVTTASDTYKGIRRLDLETADSEYIYFQDGKVKKAQIGDWTQWLDNQRQYIHPNDYNRIRSTYALENLRAMEEGVTYREDYRSARKNEDGYYLTYTTIVSVTYLGGKKTAILTTIDNSAAVIRDMEQKNLLASAASIYVSMSVLDLKNKTMDMLNSEEHVADIVGGRRNNVDVLIRETMRKLTDEQFIDAMMDFVDLDTLDSRMEGGKTITLEFLGTVSGWCRARFIAVDYDDNHCLNRVLWVIENIDTEKKKANHLQYLSETDLMTGIRNRGSGERKIREMLVKKQFGMFCLLDIDKFKSINDTFGHTVGDKVIIEVARCLKAAFRETDIVMRLGGDEFAVFAGGMTKQEEGSVYIKRFFDQINHMAIPELGGRKIFVSVGIAVKLPEENMDFETLYHKADSCAYKSKKIDGNAYTFFETE